MAKSSRYANELIDTIIRAAEVCDPVAINEFLSLAIESELAHLNLISDQLSYSEIAHRHAILSHGAVLLSLFNRFATDKLRNGLIGNEVGLG
jgi:hypothetical protein